MSAPMLTGYVRYEEISFVSPSGAGYQEEAAMMRRARAEIEHGSLRQDERVDSVEVWGSETHWPQAQRGRSDGVGTEHLTLYWYRVTITSTGS